MSKRMPLVASLHQHYQVPGWWWFVILFFAVVGLAIGLGVPLELTNELPYVRIVDPADVIVDRRIAGLAGFFIVVCLFILFVPVVKRGDRAAQNEDHTQLPDSPSGASSSKSSAPVSPVIAGPILTMISPYSVDEAGVGTALKQFGRDWKQATITWPDSSDGLISALRNGLAAFDRMNIEVAGSKHFRDDASAALGQVGDARQTAAKVLPGMIRRLRQPFSDADVATAVVSYLVYANYEIHRNFALHTGWHGFKEIPVNVPKAWEPFRDPSMEDHLERLLGRHHEKKPVSVRLVTVAGKNLYDRGGSPGCYIYVPGDRDESVLKIRERLSRSSICRWVIPQLELYAAHSGMELPDVYDDNWRFDKVSGT
ncbi:MAG: hypothetical protein AAGA21_05175 [Pseudomonadota bacterium]